MGAAEISILAQHPVGVAQDSSGVIRELHGPSQDPGGVAQHLIPELTAGPARSPAGVPQDLIIVDLETTGGNAAFHRITEIGIVRIANGELVEEWSSLVNPECRIPSYIESFTGISNEMVAHAPRFADIAALVLEKLQSTRSSQPIFVAHNARFDYSFLRAEFRRVNIHFSARVLCTVKLSRRLFPQFPRHSLDAVMERHGLKCGARHRALGDAQVLRDFWFKLRRDVPEAVLAAAAASVLASGKLPAYLPPELADELPEGPGVYRFFGEGDVLLYVGKSNSLRTRVLAHFAAEHTDSKEQKLARQVRRVDWLETAGELGALLCEAQWIKTQKPLYNRRLRQQTTAYTYRAAEDAAGSGAPAGVEARGGAARGISAGDMAGSRGAAGGSAVELLAIDELDPAGLTRCFGMFHTPQDARKALIDIARAHQLCLKILGLEPSAGSCFAYQLGKCKGACIGKESLLLHNVRLRMALSALKLRAWPFPGRVALRERGAAGGAASGLLGADAADDTRGGADFHVLDHWAYLGTARSADDLARLAAQPADGAFDADVYRILVRYFSNHPKLDWHDLSDEMRPA